MCLLPAVCWFLIVGCCLLGVRVVAFAVVVGLSLVVGCWLLVVGYLLLVVGCWLAGWLLVVVVGSWLLAGGCWLVVFGC